MYRIFQAIRIGVKTYTKSPVISQSIRNIPVVIGSDNVKGMLGVVYAYKYTNNGAKIIDQLKFEASKMAKQHGLDESKIHITDVHIINDIDAYEAWGNVRKKE
jgi:hypothetical protein